MKFYVLHSKVSEFINKKNIKKLLQTIHEKWVFFNHHMAAGTYNSMITMAVIAFSFTVIGVSISDNHVAVLERQIELSKLELKLSSVNIKENLLLQKQKDQARLELAKYQRDTEKHRARVEEARAAANPYVALKDYGRSTPVNVYINTNNKHNYVIHTSDGATEISISTITVNGKKYSPEQRKLMEMAYYIGRDVGFPETIQALLLQETRAGAYGDRIGDINLPVGKRSYGVMQMKAGTARKVLKVHPELVKKYFPNRKTLDRVREEELIIKLIQDDEFNIRLAALNFVIHRQASKTWDQAVVAYNTGQGKANNIENLKEHDYYIRIVDRLIKEVRPFNMEAELSSS